jgi:hypothetical protein
LCGGRADVSALAGLALIAEGGAFDTDGTADEGRARRFPGWSTDGHWMRNRA